MIGCSFDTTMDNYAFITANDFQYPIWSDQARDLALYYEAATSKSQGMPSRVTAVLDPDGNWILKYVVNFFNEKGHPGQVLQDLEKLFAL